MKKFLNTLLCLILSLALVLSFAACSKDKDDEKDDEETSKSDTVKDDEKENDEDEEIVDEDEEVVDEDEEIDEENDEDADEKVKAYVEKAASATEEMLSNDTMTMKVKSEGTKVVYECTILTEVDDDKKAALEEYMDSVEDTMKSMLTQMQKEEPCVSAILYRYLDKNGDLIAEATIK
ncbi:MAG: DUF4854 domain-containing protein [Ruminococcaceae bacterium]|nr:DUF4854 domain-containing protein [Oscillospiraceae bacterium]